MTAAPGPPHPSPQAALLACHASVLLFGIAGLFAKWIPWEPAAIVLGRTTIAAAALALFVRYRSGAWRRPHRVSLANGAILAVHWVAFFEAIQVSTVAIGLLGYASFPLFVPILERTMLGLRMTRNKLAGAALVAFGIALLVPELTWHSRTLQGLAWGVLSGFTFALLTVRTRKYAPDQRSSELALGQNAIAALCVLPVVIVQGGPGGPLNAAVAGQLLALGVVCTAVAHTLFAASLVHVPASVASVCAALEPVYGIALAAVLLGEVPDARTLAGAGIVVAAAIVASRRASLGPREDPA
ncbi:MAG: DMT family transporter [Burkholderiales bacterium]